MINYVRASSADAVNLGASAHYVIALRHRPLYPQVRVVTCLGVRFASTGFVVCARKAICVTIYTSMIYAACPNAAFMRRSVSAILLINACISILIPV